MEHKKDENKRDLGTSLIKSVLSNGGADIVGDVAKLAFDTALDNDILKDIPVFGWFIKGYGLVSTVRDRIFLKKIALFLKGASACGNTSELVEEMKDPTFCQKAGEDLLLLLDRHDNFDKAIVLGKVFKGYLLGMIDYDMFLRIAASIDRALIADLNSLTTYYDNIKSYEEAPKVVGGVRFKDFINDEVTQSLCNAGLAFSSNSVAEDVCTRTVVGTNLIHLLYEAV